MGRLDLALLGAPVLRHDGQPLAFPTRKTAALLIFLAVDGGLQPRGRLTALLWPDSDEEHARRSLRTTLAFLNRLLHDGGAAHLVVTGGRLGVAPDAGLALDLQTIQEASAVARAGAPLLTPAQTGVLRAAASFYRGEFLDGFSLRDAPEFDEWAAIQRETWHRRAESIFNRLTQALADRGDQAEAIELTERWTALDPLNESAYRRLMRLYFAAGERSAALGVYESCRAILAVQLGAEPASETSALAARIRLQPSPARSEPRANEPAVPLVTVDGPLVGRSAEHARLAEAFRAASRGRPQAVVIEGEAGAGKSRLAAEFARWASGQGADVLQGRAFETGGRVPYQPLVDALRARVERENAPDDLLSDTWLAELSRLLPELRDRYPDLPPALSRNDAEARTALFEAVARLVEGLAGRAPVVLLLDDLQWAGAAALDLLQHAARRWGVAATPVLLVACLRSEDAEPATAAWPASLEREVPVQRVPLAPLTPDDTIVLAAALASAQEAEPFGRWLFEETGGQPLYISETLKALYERGELQPGAPPPPARLGELRGFLAPGVQALIRLRIAGVRPVARRALAAAAVLGHGFSFDQLRGVGELPEEEALTALDELLARRLLRETGSPAERYLFGHDKIREVAYAEAGETRRRVYHRRALALLETVAPAAALMQHALAAGLPERAFSLAIAAGEEAQRLFATRDAILHLEQARALLEARSDDAPAWSVTGADLERLYTRLGRAYELVTEYGAARAVYEEFLGFARRAGDAVRECLALNRLATLLSNASLNLETVATLLHEAQAIAEASGDAAGLAETEWNLSRLHFFRSDMSRGYAHAERSLVLARGVGSKEPVARTLNWMAIQETVHGRYAEAEGHAREAVELYATLGDRAMEADSLGHLAGALIRLGRHHEAVEVARKYLAMSDAIDNVWGRGSACWHLSAALHECGEYAESLARAEAAVIAARSAGYPPLLLLSLAQLGAVRRTLGDLAGARAAHAEAAAKGMPEFPPFVELVAGERCADAAFENEWERAAVHAREALAVRMYEVLFAGFTRPAETEALLRAGEAQRVEEDLHRLCDRAGDNPRYRLAYLRSRALLDVHRQDAEAAIDALQEAGALARSARLPGELWQVEASLAELHAARGDAQAADDAGLSVRTAIDTLAAAIADAGTRQAFLATGPVRRALERCGVRPLAESN